MQTYIALLRGINVGGYNKLPMAELKKVLTQLGLQAVQTYIQSGNVLFQADDLDFRVWEAKISQAIAESHGFAPQIMLLTSDTLTQAMTANPFSQAVDAPKSLHLYFLAEAAPDPDLAKLDTLKKADEECRLLDQVFYLYAPSGIGRSKLAAQVEKALAVPCTARNWRTVSKLAEMVAESTS